MDTEEIDASEWEAIEKAMASVSSQYETSRGQRQNYSMPSQAKPPPSLHPSPSFASNSHRGAAAVPQQSPSNQYAQSSKATNSLNGNFQPPPNSRTSPNFHSAQARPFSPTTPSQAVNKNTQQRATVSSKLPSAASHSLSPHMNAPPPLRAKPFEYPTPKQEQSFSHSYEPGELALEDSYASDQPAGGTFRKLHNRFNKNPQGGSIFGPTSTVADGFSDPYEPFEQFDNFMQHTGSAQNNMQTPSSVERNQGNLPPPSPSPSPSPSAHRASPNALYGSTNTRNNWNSPDAVANSPRNNNWSNNTNSNFNQNLAGTISMFY